MIIKHPRTTTDQKLLWNIEVQIEPHINQDKPANFKNKIINKEHRKLTLPENQKCTCREHGPTIRHEDQDISNKGDLNQTSTKEDGR